MRDVSFGQYYPADSVIHKLDPRIKLILMLMYIVMVFFINTFIAYAMLFAFIIIVILMSKVPIFKVFKSLKAILYIVIFTTVLSVLFYRGENSDLLWEWTIIKIYKEGLLNAAKMALRLVMLVLGPSVLTLTTTPVALTDGLESLLKPLKVIKFPVHELTMIMSIALRLIPTLIEETDKIMMAQKARGADFESRNIFKKAKALIPVLIPLFVSSFRRADELADAMDSRCYRGAVGRTRMKVLKVHFADILSLIVMAAVFFGFLVLYYQFFGVVLPTWFM